MSRPLYGVVRFIHEDCVSEVPLSWIVTANEEDHGVDYCWWPSRIKNVSPLITKLTAPDQETWEKCPIIVEKLALTLEKARKLAADEAYVTTDDDKLGKGSRQKHSLIYSSDEENSEKENYHKKKKGKLSPPPAYSGSKPTITSVQVIHKSDETNNNHIKIIPLHSSLTRITKKNETDSCDNSENITHSSCSNSLQKDNTQKSAFRQIQIDNPLTHDAFTEDDILNAEIIINAPSGDNDNLDESHQPQKQQLNVTSTITCDHSEWRKYFEKILKLQAMNNIHLKSINQRLTNLEKGKINSNPTGPDLTTPFLPLENIENVKSFETLIIGNETAAVQLKLRMLSVGGNSPRDNIHRILTRLFTNELGTICPWKGLRNNFAVEKLKIMKMFKDAMCSIHDSLTEKEFEDTVAEWLRFSKQSHARERKAQ